MPKFQIEIKYDDDGIMIIMMMIMMPKNTLRFSCKRKIQRNQPSPNVSQGCSSIFSMYFAMNQVK